MVIAKYRKDGFPKEWFLTDFTMEQVEGRLENLEAENARLREALRECVEVLEKFTCPECKPKNPLCVVTGEPPCEIVSIPKKAREVLGVA